MFVFSDEGKSTFIEYYREILVGEKNYTKYWEHGSGAEAYISR